VATEGSVAVRRYMAMPATEFVIFTLRRITTRWGGEAVRPGSARQRQRSAAAGRGSGSSMSRPRTMSGMLPTSRQIQERRSNERCESPNCG